MNLLSIFDFITSHIQLVVTGTTVLILAISIPILWISLKAPANQGSDLGSGIGPADLKSLEGTLKKILEDGGAQKGSSHSENGLTAKRTFAAGDSQIDGIQAQLQAELEIKEKELQALRESTTLKTNSDSAGEASSSASRKELSVAEEKISELEARLREYEIIEDDIADLSKYKEENAKLRQEIEAQGLSAPLIASASAPQSLEELAIENTAELVSDDAVTSAPEMAETGSSVAAQADDNPFSDILGQLEAQSDLQSQASPADSIGLTTEAADSVTQDQIDILMQTTQDEISEPEDASVEQMLTDQSFKDAQNSLAEAPEAEPEPKDEIDTLGAELMQEFQAAEKESERINADSLLNEMAALESFASNDSTGANIEDLNTDKLVEEAQSLSTEEKD